MLADNAKNSQADLSSPVELLKDTPDPTYCAICACPCLRPRLPTPQPDDPDLPHTANLPTPAWLHQYHHLQPSRCILPYPYEPQPLPAPHRAYHTSPQQHIVPVHLYCLRAVISITQSGMWNCTSDHPDSMMVGWSIPRWTGYGPWVKNLVARPDTDMGWSGFADQKKRFIAGIEGSHLRSCDLISPLTLDTPVDHTPTPPIESRQPQTSLLPNMPSHIITEIAHYLLTPSAPGGQCPPKELDDVLAFCRTSHTFRHLDLPEHTWSELTLAAVHRFRNDQVQRWRANPTGSGGTSQVWIALDQTFVEPIERALSEAQAGRMVLGPILDREQLNAEPEGSTVSARDVLYWWLYSNVWRSRRRVWRSVIYACAAARNADWIEEWYYV